jgi:ribonuclease-3
VCENTLSDVARKLNIGAWLLLSKGEKQSGGDDKNAILCDVFESVVAAIYLDSDMSRARQFILDNLKDIIIKQANLGNDSSDYKTNLQELVQQRGHEVEYKIISESGPDHAREYEAAVYINGELVATGDGTSKKKAHQSAAKNALVKYQ